MRKRRGDDAGFSLVEMLVVMSMFSALMVIVFAILVQVMGQSRDNLARAQGVTQARLGISQIDRQVRSGNLILNPALEDPNDSDVPANYSLRIYTQESGVPRCAQWRVKYDDASDPYGELQFRSWDPGYPSSVDVDEWTVVAFDVARPPHSPVSVSDPKSWPPFWIDPTVRSGDKVQNVRITLRMLDQFASDKTKPATVSSVVTGRNTVFGYSEYYCSEVPEP